MSYDFTQEQRIAYFSMEIAIHNDIPTYSGGLGILAGDSMRSSADLNIPLVAVSLVSRGGYFRQEIDAEGWQIEHPDSWDPNRWAKPLHAKISIAIEGRPVWIRGWLYILEGHNNCKLPIILLDTNLDENQVDDRDITGYLYGGDLNYRLKQEIVLGIGGVRMLHALGFKIRHYHMNEGHSAFLGLELLRRHSHPVSNLTTDQIHYDIPQVRRLCDFTTHTPIEAGHDKFPYHIVQRVLGDFVDLEILKSLAGRSELNMTRLALNLSKYVNGVTKRHAEVSRQLFPGYRVNAITNGVHPSTWTHEAFANLFDKYIADWRHEPEILIRAVLIPDEDIWKAHILAKSKLIDTVKNLTSVQLDPDVALLGFARRMTAYKRPDLVFSDLRRLRAIAEHQPFQLIMAGKAHPHDEQGKKLIRALHDYMRDLKGVITMVFIPNYNMQTARAMVSGVDVWLNTPIRPMEASGTSGMKAAFNGVPSLSVMDGWWIEGCIEDITGWSIGSASELSNRADAGYLYDKLEQVVLPLYYKDRARWIALMKNVIVKNASYFNSHRMMRYYATEVYLR